MIPRTRSLDAILGTLLLSLVGGCGGSGGEARGEFGSVDVKYATSAEFNGNRGAFGPSGVTWDGTLEAMSSGALRTLTFTYPERRGVVPIDGVTAAAVYHDFSLEPDGRWIAERGTLEVVRSDAEHVDVRTTKLRLVPDPIAPGSARGTMVLTARIAL